MFFCFLILFNHIIDIRVFGLRNGMQANFVNLSVVGMLMTPWEDTCTLRALLSWGPPA